MARDLSSHGNNFSGIEVVGTPMKRVMAMVPVAGKPSSIIRSDGATYRWLISSVPCILGCLNFVLITAAAHYIKLYNRASLPDVSVVSPDLYWRVGSAQSTPLFNAPAHIFDTGLVLVVTTGAADNDTTAPAAWASGAAGFSATPLIMPFEV